MPNSDVFENIEQIEPLEPVFEFLEMLISRYGLAGIAAAMFAESAGLPFASIVVLLTAGTMILRGSFSFLTVFLASTIGITLGSIFSYIIGLLGSMAGTAVKAGFLHHPPRIELEKDKSEQSHIARLWKKYGNFSIFMAQLWGITRTFGSFPAGAMHVNFFLFVIYTFLGGALFSFLYVASSIVLTGTMGVAYNLLRSILEISPWLFAAFILILAAAIFLILYRRRKGIHLTPGRVWQKLKKALGYKKC